MIVHKLRPVAMALLVLAAVTSLADDGVQLDLDANHAASKPGSRFRWRRLSRRLLRRLAIRCRPELA